MSSSYPNIIAIDAPTAYWRLGESSGTVAAAAVGAYAGTYNGGATLGQSGAIAGDADTAPSFDGVDDYVSTSGLGAVFGGRTTATMEAWIYRASTADTIMVGFLTTTNRRFGIQWANDGKIYAVAENGSASFPNAPLTGTGWHHVSLRYNGGLVGLARLSLRIDGVAATLTAGGATPVASLAITANLGEFSIGRLQSLGTFGKGKVDEVALYTGVLSDARSDVHYNDGISASHPTTAPTIASAAVPAAGTTLVLTFAAEDTPPILPATGVTGFTVTGSGGTSVTVSSAARTAAGEITLTLARTLYRGEPVQYAYSGGNVTDTATNALATITATTATNASTVDAPAGSSEVVFEGTVFGSTGTASHLTDKAIDGDLTTYWESGVAEAEPNHIGMDCGAAVTLRRVRVAPRSGDGTTDYEDRMAGFKVQGSNTSTAAGFVDLLTDDADGFPYLPRYQLNDVPVYAAAVAYRYYRLTFPNGTDGTLAEIQFVGEPGAVTDARPDRPTVSPWGGGYATGSTTVALTTRTAGASIYYTTDGTTPTTSSTLYTVPFTLTIGAGAKTVKAIAVLASLDTDNSDVSSAVFNPWTWKPGEDWNDDRGVLTQAFGGCVLDDTDRSGRYYWYGAFTNRANHGVDASPLSTKDTRGNKGVWCYSSTDLRNWRFEGHVLTNSGYTWLERPHAVYNASTGKYVLWAHLSNNHTSADRAGVATADAPQGPWAWVNTAMNPNGLLANGFATSGVKDQSLFQDDDGTAYHVFTRGDQGAVVIARLNAAYTSYDTASGAWVTAIAEAREAPQLLRRGDVYFLITSTSNYYDSGATFDPTYLVNEGATPLAAWPAYATKALLHASDPVGTSYNAQPAFVFEVPGKVDGYVYGSDRWSNTELYVSRQVWLPITFPTDTTMQAGVPASWDLSTFADDASPSPAVSGAGGAIADGGTDDAGTVTEGATLTRTYTIANEGDGDLELGTVTVETGLTITVDPSDETVAPAGETTLTVTVDTDSAGVFSYDVSVPSNHADSPYNWTVEGEVTEQTGPDYAALRAKKKKERFFWTALRRRTRKTRRR